METIYDLIILGAGLAGLTAGLYGDRYRLNTLLAERGQNDGQIAITSDIENYPNQMMGAEEPGATPIARTTKQVDKFDIHRVSAPVEKVELEGLMKRLTDTRGNVYEGKTVIIATGTHPGPIGCKNEKKFPGKGISPCVTCGANFYEDMEVYVVGGGGSAIEEAIYLTRFTRKVTVIHRRDQLGAAQFIQEKAFRNEKLHFIWDSVVDEVRGNEVLDAMATRNVRTGELTQVNTDPNDGMFGLSGFIGYLPSTDLLGDTDLTMEGGYVRTDGDMRTNLSGVYTVGDVRVKSPRQVVTTATGGATVTCQAEHYVVDLQ